MSAITLELEVHGVGTIQELRNRLNGGRAVGFTRGNAYQRCPFEGSASMRADLRNTDPLYIPIDSVI